MSKPAGPASQSTPPAPFDRGPAFALPQTFEFGGTTLNTREFLTYVETTGLLILRNDQLVFEDYWLGNDGSTQSVSWSVAKSFVSALMGIAIAEGAIHSVEDPVTRYAPELTGSSYDGVRLKDVLQMSSGTRWNEDYSDVNSDVARMYAQAPEPGFDMTVSYVRKLPREAPPGRKWVYKTSETNLVGVLVAEATKKPLAQYLSEKIWRAYGMERDAAWMIDDVGHEQGGCCLAVTLRDFGRFGQFILDGARVGGKPIVADTWLAEATRAQVSTGAGSGYGYQWWTRDNGTFEVPDDFDAPLPEEVLDAFEGRGR